MSAPEAAERVARSWQVLDGVPDPEVPVISLCELGIVRDVVATGQGIEVVLTPTYSGCPATEVIAASAVEALERAGLGPVTVSQRRAPAWTTDWISDQGRRKLLAYGIVPPAPVGGSADAGGVAGAAGEPAVVPMRFMPRRGALRLACPRCGSGDTEQLAAFGSTACKALHRCRACTEPFEHFKPL